MSYHVLARKWRPQSFADMVGQTHVVKALTYALSHQQIHHAYLFTGTRGVGKTSIARIFAKSLNCERNGVSANPCGECETCREIAQGKFVDLIEVDAASRTGVDETRELIDSVAYLPTKGRYKVYLIDEVHMFSKSSFNALLKTLEEPPEHVKFILATTDPEKLPITILSRCLQFNLKSLTPAQIRQHLENICEAESIAYDKEALALLATAGDGSMRDTLSMTDQAIAYGHGELRLSAVTEILGTIQPNDIEAILFAIATNNPNQLSQALQRLDDYEVDARAFLIEIMRRLQRMAWAKEGIVEHLSPALQSTINDIPKPLLHLWYDIAEKALPNLAIAGEPRQAVEMALLRMLAFIPSDWVVRHRTLLDAPHAPSSEEETPPSVEAPAQPTPTAATETPAPVAEFAEQVHASPVTPHDSLDAAEAEFSGEAPTVEAPQHAEALPSDSDQPAVMPTETPLESPLEVPSEMPLEMPPIHARAPQNQPETIAESAQPTPQEAPQEPEGVPTTTPTTSDGEHDAAPSAAPQAKNTQNWHLSSDDNDQEPAPSMDEVRQLMQSGRDITAPQQPKPQPAAVEEAQPTSHNDTPPWEAPAEAYIETPIETAVETQSTETLDENTAVAKSDIDIDIAQPAPTPAQDAQPDNVAQASDEADDIPSATQAPAPQAPVEAEPQHVEPPTATPETPAQKTAPADVDQFDWYDTLQALGLSEYTHHMASVGILRLEKQDDYLQATLTLSPKHQPMLTEEGVHELSQALENHFAIPINLQTELASIEEITPSERDKLASDKQQADLQEMFRQEPITQQVLDMFDGQVIEKTVKAKTETE